jgi:hypothetical protein
MNKRIDSMHTLKGPQQNSMFAPPPLGTRMHRQSITLRKKSSQTIPHLIDIDPLLLSTIELEIMLNVPINTFPRSYLMNLATCAAQHFIKSGRYPGWGARFDVVQDSQGRVMGASYRYERCVCMRCPGWNARHRGWVGCVLPKHMRRY